MKIEEYQRRIKKIFDIYPALKEIFLSSAPVEFKRSKLRELLSEMLVSTFDEDKAIPSLEWILTRNAAMVLQSILSKRSEGLAGFSLLQYVTHLYNGDELHDIRHPAPAFLLNWNI